MATLHGEPIYPGCDVYDIAYGPGTVTAVEAGNKIHVSFGSSGRPRQYSSDGMTGKLCGKTLFHTPPVIVTFCRDECAMTRKRAALEGVMKIFDDISKIDCCSPQPEKCCEPKNDCCQ